MNGCYGIDDVEAGLVADLTRLAAKRPAMSRKPLLDADPVATQIQSVPRAISRKVRGKEKPSPSSSPSSTVKTAVPQ